MESRGGLVRLTIKIAYRFFIDVIFKEWELHAIRKHHKENEWNLINL